MPIPTEYIDELFADAQKRDEDYIKSQFMIAGSGIMAGRMHRAKEPGVYDFVFLGMTPQGRQQEIPMKVAAEAVLGVGMVVVEEKKSGIITPGRAH